MWCTKQRQLQKRDLRELHVMRSTQEVTRSDLGITYRKEITPYDHSAGLGTYLWLGVRVQTTIVAEEAWVEHPMAALAPVEDRR
jgi:hypothetical protein